jgi:hypothetical protein
MIDLEHQAWPDMSGADEVVQLADQRLNEALAIVALRNTEHITPRRLDVLQAIGQHDSSSAAHNHLGIAPNATNPHIWALKMASVGDNKNVRLFNVGRASLVYLSWSEGLVPYELDTEWKGHLSPDESITLKTIALQTTAEDMQHLGPVGKYEWWTRSMKSTVGKKLGVLATSPAGRIVGRAFEVGLFIPKNDELPVSG